MLLDLVNRIISERKVKKKLDIQVWVLSSSSRGRPENVGGSPESTFQGRPLNVRLRRPLDVFSGRLQDVRLRRPQDVRLGRLRDGQIGSLGDVLGALEGDVLGTNICRLGRDLTKLVLQLLCPFSVKSFTKNFISWAKYFSEQMCSAPDTL